MSFNRSRKNSRCVSRLHARDRSIREQLGTHSRHTNSIYFFDIGVESLRQDGWTDKWMYVVRSILSSIRGCVKDSRFASLESTLVRLVSIFFSFFFSPCLFAFVYSFVHIFSSLLLRRACVRVPLERPLQILEDLSIVWKHTFIFEESFGPTERHVLANYVEDLIPGVKKITISRWYENLILIFDESTLE